MKIVLPKSYVQLKISWTLVIDADASISLDMILQNAGKIYTRNTLPWISPGDLNTCEKNFLLRNRPWLD